MKKFIPSTKTISSLAITSLFTSLAFADPFARANTTLNTIVTGLITLAVAVVTLAVLFAGFQILFNQKKLTDQAPILIGAGVIASAAAIAALLLG